MCVSVTLPFLHYYGAFLCYVILLFDRKPIMTVMIDLRTNSYAYGEIDFPAILVNNKKALSGANNTIAIIIVCILLMYIFYRFYECRKMFESIDFDFLFF